MGSKIMIFVAGDLKKDPDLKYSPDGNTAICKLSMTGENVYTKKDGGKIRETIWIDCTLFGKKAENANAYLRKGRTAFLVGRLSGDKLPKDDYNDVAQFTIVPHSWKDKTTEESRAKWGMIVDDITYLGSGTGGSDKPAEEPTEEDEIPF